MSKLTEWIVFAGLAFSLWITLLVDFFPIRISYKAKEVLWPVSMEVSRETMHFNCNLYQHSTKAYLVRNRNDLSYLLLSFNFQMPVYALIAFGVSEVKYYSKKNRF